MKEFAEYLHFIDVVNGFMVPRDRYSKPDRCIIKKFCDRRFTLSNTWIAGTLPPTNDALSTVFWNNSVIRRGTPGTLYWSQSSMRTILVTGGAGFIGSNFVLQWLHEVASPLVNLDKLTYAGNINNLSSITGDERHHFIRGDICDGKLVSSLLSEFRPCAIVHFAAETHVDRSVLSPADFVQTNVTGTFTLLEAVRA